jgi:hypothetical protein
LSTMTCPRCSAEAKDDAVDCPSCGIIFAKWRKPRSAPPTETATTAPAAVEGLAGPWVILKDPPAPPPPEYLGIPHAGWKAAAIGLAMAVALTFFPFLKFLLHPLSTLVHEIGHTVVFWAFGYSAVPAFDFSEGGGVTMTDYDRSALIVWAWVTGFVALAWWQREKKAVLAALAGIAVVYFLMYNSRGERLAISLGGHGAEVVFGALFLYRGLTGWGCKIEAERPLYAFLAFMLLFASLGLGFTLLGNSIDKAWYLQGKRGIDNDLVMGALYLGLKIEGMARLLIGATLLAIPAAFWAASMRRTIGAVSEAEEEV